MYKPFKLMTYEALEAELWAHGFRPSEDGLCLVDPNGDEAAFVDSLREMCHIYPALIPGILEIMLYGHGCQVLVDKKNPFETTITLTAVESGYPQPVWGRGFQQKFRRLAPIEHLGREAP